MFLAICNSSSILYKPLLRSSYCLEKTFMHIIKKLTSFRRLKSKDNLWLGAVAHAYNPSTLGGWDGRITWGQEFETGGLQGQEFETSLANMMKPCLYWKNTKISQAWYHVLVIPATWEAEVGESLEPGKWRLQWAKIVKRHSSLGNRARLHLKKKKWQRLGEK